MLAERYDFINDIAEHYPLCRWQLSVRYSKPVWPSGAVLKRKKLH
jgi:hypothetical protein